MKVLVISLLRLGDFLQVVPVLEGLSKRPGVRQVDVLTHAPTRALWPLLPQVKTWWTLDRDELQEGLGRADVPLLTSYDVLKEQLDQISAESYDLVINLTHTKFSGWVAGYVQGKEKLGLAFSATGQAHFHSPWFRYLDRHSQVKSPDVFNYTDIFLQACGLKSSPRQWTLQDKSGDSELQGLGLKNIPTLIVQLFTSDPKKTWSEESWVRTLELLRRPDLQVVLLGSAAERKGVERVAARTGAIPAILSLPGALALLNHADVLLTGDTSIKHLANGARARVMELSLGPSDVLRTGVYKEDSLILQPRVACAPCPHSAPCSQSTHACAQSLDPAVVAAAVSAFFTSDWDVLANQARAAGQVSFLRTRHLETGFWFASELNPAQPLTTLERLLDRCTLKFLLNQEFKRDLVEFGSEGVRLTNEIQRLLPRHSSAPVLAHLDFMEKELGRDHERAQFVRTSFARAQAGRASLNLAQVRSEQQQVEDDARQTEIKMKLIRSLKSRYMEME
jgi:ADP-heptose:LPS heptosyltransferase